MIEAKCSCVARALANHTHTKKENKNRFRVVYKGSRGPSDCSVCSAQSLTPIYRCNQPVGEGREAGRQAGENVVISRPDKPPPEVVLIERQPCRWANRKILSGPRTEPTNQPGRGAGAFWSRGEAWGERTGASAGSAPHYRGILLQRRWLNPARGEERGSGWSCGARGCSGDGVGRIGLENAANARLSASKAGALLTISDTRASLKSQSGLLCTIC